MMQLPKAANNWLVLEAIVRLNTDFLPSIDEEKRLVGVVERSQIIASLGIDVTEAMEGIKQTAVDGAQ